MLCSRCKKENANFLYKQNINGKQTSVALCNNCAKAYSSNFLSFDVFDTFTEDKCTKNTKVCNLCGFRFSDIRSIGKVGCPECYNTFSDELDGIIKQIHGTATHTGTTPIEHTTYKKSELEILKDELNNAISEENYEEAAKIRDKIKDLKGE